MSMGMLQTRGRLCFLLAVISAVWLPGDLSFQIVKQREGAATRIAQPDEGERELGLLIGAEEGLAGWLDAEAVLHALKRTASLRSTGAGARWNAKLFCHSNPHEMEREVFEGDGKSTGLSGAPPGLASCRGSLCLGGLAESAQVGSELQEWASGLSAMIVVGVPWGNMAVRSVASACRQWGAFCVLLPTERDMLGLMDGGRKRASLESALQEWATLLKNGEVWARGPTEERILRGAGLLRTTAVPWSAPEAVVRHADENAAGQQMWIRHLQGVEQQDGFGTGQPREGLVAVIVLANDGSCELGAIVAACEAVGLAQKVAGRSTSATPLRLLVAVLDLHRSPIEGRLQVEEACNGIQWDVQSFRDGQGLRVLQTQADMCLDAGHCVAAAWGSVALRCLHAGLPVVSKDMWPANETITHMHDGILVGRRDSYADTREREHDQGTEDQNQEKSLARLLSDALLLLLSTQIPLGLRSTYLRRLSAPQPGLLTAKQYAHALHVQHRLALALCATVLEKPITTPRVVSLWPGPHELHRRTELFRSDALRRHGFDVRETTYSANLFKPGKIPDFLIAAKPSAQDLLHAKAQGAPVYIWTWDLIDYVGDDTRRAWFEGVARESSSAFLNEMGREEMWEGLGARVRYVGDGTVLVGDRGSGRRPFRQPLADVGGDAVFIGSVNTSAGGDGYRLGVLKELMNGGFTVEVYGPEQLWASVGVRTHGEVWAGEAAEVEASARVVLSLSRSPPALDLYHSDRLMRGTAAGACVVANSFRSLDLLLPSGSVVGVREQDGPDAVRHAVQELLGDEGKRARLRARAEEVTWRRHTWEDAVGRFLRFVSMGLGEKPRAMRRPDSVSTAERSNSGSAALDQWRDEGAWKRDKCEASYYARVGWGLLRGGDASEALIYLGFAFEACPLNGKLARAASLCALQAGELVLAQRLWQVGSRVEGGWRWTDGHTTPLHQTPAVCSFDKNCSSETDVSFLASKGASLDGDELSVQNQPKTVDKKIVVPLEYTEGSRARAMSSLAWSVGHMCNDANLMPACVDTVGLRARAGGWVARGVERVCEREQRACAVFREILRHGDRELGISCWVG